jgi:hypothetical protein
MACVFRRLDSLIDPAASNRPGIRLATGLAMHPKPRAETPEATTDEIGRQFTEAIRRKVCAVCLDSRDDFSCGLTGRRCALDTHLPQLAEVLSGIKSPRLDEYIAAVRGQICSGCVERAADGRCELRASAACALDAYLPLVVDAIEKVNARRAS